VALNEKYSSNAVWLNSELDMDAVKTSVKKLSGGTNSESDIASVKSSFKKTMSPFLATENGATSVALTKHFGFMKKMSRSGAAPQESSEVQVSVASKSKSKHFNNLSRSSLL
jgi:copper chaperone CopZ